MQWWTDYFNDVDTMDPARFGAWFADDMQLQFNNAPVFEGKAAVLGFLHEFTKNFSSLKHSHGQLVGDEASAAGEAMITFGLPNDAQYTVRGVTMVTRDQTGFRRMAIYADFSEIYAAVQGA